MTQTFTQKILTAASLLMLTAVRLYSQADAGRGHKYDSLSLSDLLNIKVVTVSRIAETIFESPLSASVITRDDILKNQCTSIMEALRLIPGMIVREQSNGNYDVQLRGVYNVPNSAFEGNAVGILVMIDGRPIFNYLKGITFWETLPVDLNDIKRIEVVKGPAAALYGPNAVNGVINIITRRINRKGLYLEANSRQGGFHTHINNAFVSYKINKWSLRASGNYQHRGRTQTSYYEMNRDQLMQDPAYFLNIEGDTVETVNTMFPRKEVAMEKYGANVFVTFEPTNKMQYNLSTGVQHSLVQKASFENRITPLSTAVSDSRYVDLRTIIGQFTVQTSYVEGTQVADQRPGNTYHFNTFDAATGYNFLLLKKTFLLRPGLSFRSAMYDDTRYSDTANKAGLFNDRGQIITTSASLRAEGKVLKKKVRLVAALVANHFNHPDSTYLSVELAATYRLRKNHIVRAVFSQAPRSNTVYDLYVNQNVRQVQTSPQHYDALRIQGNKHLRLLTANMFEVGYRGRIGANAYIEVEAFDIRSKGYSNNIFNQPYQEVNGSDSIHIFPLIPTNIPFTSIQQGITISLTCVTKKVSFNPFVTIQQTKGKNYSPYINTPDGTPAFSSQYDPTVNNIYSGQGTTIKLKSTPAVFGGASANYLATSTLNLNLNAYYYSAYTMDHYSNLVYNDGVRGIDRIHAKFILNASVAYKPYPGLHLVATAKNVLNNTSREYYHSDKVPFQLIAGLHYEF